MSSIRQGAKEYGVLVDKIRIEMFDVGQIGQRQEGMTQSSPCQQRMDFIVLRATMPAVSQGDAVR